MVRLGLLAAVTKVFISVAKPATLVASVVARKLLLVLIWLAKVWSFWIKPAMD